MIIIKTRKDHVGERFGRLVVMANNEDIIGANGKVHPTVDCQCDCGNYIYRVRTCYLTSGQKKSCGCLVLEQVEDLTGQRFGRLTVIERVEGRRSPSGQLHAMWLCKCDCGNEVKVSANSLKNGTTLSCGCYHKERTSECSSKQNKYDLTTYDYGICYTSDNIPILFDKDDYELIKNYYWFINSDGYAYAYTKYNDKFEQGSIPMHRLIMGCVDNKDVDVDHIRQHGDYKVDNRKSELRICTTSQNCMNHVLSNNNTSGYAGVYYYKNINKWYARITANNVVYNLGTFDNFQDAVKARQEAELKYFGEFRYSAHNNPA